MKTLLLHGALANKNQFEVLKLNLGDNCIIPDLPAHGDNSLSESEMLTFPMLIAYTLRFLETTETPVNVFGYSMGGYIALYLAHHYPNKINRVITLGTVVNWDNDILERDTENLNPDRFLEVAPAFVSQLQQKHQTDWRLLLQNIKELLADITQNNYLKPEVLMQIDKPCLLMVGENDGIAGVNATKEAASNISGSNFEIIPGKSHTFEKYDMHILAQRIQKFYND